MSFSSSERTVVEDAAGRGERPTSARSAVSDTAVRLKKSARSSPASATRRDQGRTPVALAVRVLLWSSLLAAGTAFGGIGERPEVLLDRLEAGPFEQTEKGFASQSLHFEIEERGNLVYGISGEGTMDEAGAAELGELIGAATGYGEGIAQPVREFFEAQTSEVAGEGWINLSVELYLLGIEIEPEPPHSFEFSLVLQEIPEEEFPETANILGPDDAPIVIREFSDFQCPFCARYSQEVVPVLMRELLAEGDVRFEYHHLPLDSIHANARPAAEASECVAAYGGQEQFWRFHDALFASLEEWQGLDDPVDFFVELAHEAGVERDVARTCMVEREFEGKVEASYRIATQVLGLRGTPSVFVGGFRLENPFDLAEYEEKLELVEAFSRDE